MATTDEGLAPPFALRYSFTMSPHEWNAADYAENSTAQLVDRYIARFPIDANGAVHVAMVRLEAHLVKTR